LGAVSIDGGRDELAMAVAASGILPTSIEPTTDAGLTTTPYPPSVVERPRRNVPWLSVFLSAVIVGGLGTLFVREGLEPRASAGAVNDPGVGTTGTPGPTSDRPTAEVKGVTLAPLATTTTANAVVGTASAATGSTAAPVVVRSGWRVPRTSAKPAPTALVDERDPWAKQKP
jgi:hypothetical protein